MPWKAPYEGCAGGCVLEPSRGVRHSPAEGVCHSPAEGVCQRGRQSTADECSGGGVPEEGRCWNRRMPWEASYVGGGVRRRGVL